LRPVLSVAAPHIAELPAKSIEQPSGKLGPMFIRSISNCAIAGIIVMGLSPFARANNPLVVKTDQGKLQG
jgi:hypothetical protein